MALAKVPAPPAPEGGAAPVDVTEHIRLEVIRTRIFDQALKIVEFYDPKTPGVAPEERYTHDLSMAAYKAVKAVDLSNLPADSMYGQVGPLLVGPVALLTFPAVSPAHLAAALSILAPSPPAFPPPTRRKNPGYYDLTTQSALQKLLLVGGRVEDRVFDLDGVRWVGGIDGGRDGLRAQLVHLLQSAGLGLTSALEGAGKSVWLTLEGRRTMLEDEAKEPEEAEKKEGEAQS
jgi:large subunit ribosomal protein L10